MIEQPQTTQLSTHTVDSILEAIGQEIHSIYLLAEQGETFHMDNLWTLSHHLIQCIRTDRRIVGSALFSSKSEFTVDLHSLNTAIVAAYIGLQTLRDLLQLNLLVTTACIHDIGMVKVPDDILLKQTLLSNHEIKLIRRHPVIGNRLIYDAGVFSNRAVKKMIGEIILQEHERDSGIGYPYQLTAEQIHMLSTLLGLCDTYETLTHNRPWREKLHPSVALREVARLNKSHFPGNCVDAFIRSLTYFPIGTTVKLSDGRVGEVIDVHTDDPVHPKIHIVDNDTDGIHIIDLHSNQQYSVNQIILSE